MNLSYQEGGGSHIWKPVLLVCQEKRFMAFLFDLTQKAKNEIRPFAQSQAVLVTVGIPSTVAQKHNNP